MMQTFTIDDHGQGMEKALALLREHGYSVTEPGYPSEHLSRFTQFAVQHAFVQVFWITADSRFLYVNDSACRSLGFTREELMQMSVADIDPVFPNKESREFAEGWQALREKRSLRLETFHRSRDGRVYPVEIHANLIEFEGQEYNCAFVMDITERKKAERELKLMRFVIDKASISVFRGHEDGRVLYANEHAARVLGYTVEELTSMTFFDFCPLINEKWWKEHRRLLRAQGCRKVEGVHRRKDGCIIPVETTISYVEFEGEPFSCSFSQDISDRRRAEAALTESEKKFRSLAETSPNAIVVIQKGRIVYANPAATEISGFSVEQLSGLDFWNLIHHDFRNIAHHRLLARQRGETVSNRQEYRIVTSCGEDRWVMATSAMIDFESMPAVLVTLVDISEVKLAEEALRESEARLRLAMEMAKLVQWEYDGATRLFSFDDQFYTLYGTSAVEEGGMLMSPESYVRRFVHPDDAEVVTAKMKQLLTDKGSNHQQAEHRIIRADGETRYISARWEIIRDSQGRVLRARGANQDITDMKRTEEERKSLESQLHQVQKIEAVGQLAGGVAHDFNNILTAIMGFTEVVAMRMEPENPLQKYLKQIDSAGRKAADLTHGLLAFSRKQVLHMRILDIYEVIDGFRKMLCRLIPEDIDLRMKAAATGMTVMADKGQIEQVLMNLVTNARDAMPDGGIVAIEAAPVEIGDETIHAWGFGVPGRYAMISVSDTGCGMDRQTREKIFEPFFTTKPVGKGTGLGLSIIYGIVKQHNGFITVDSLPGRGSTFNVYLPLTNQEKQDLPECGQRHDPTPGGAETVLLAEDDDAVRELHRMTLEEAGYAVIETTDGREALSKFKQFGSRIHILVTDVVMRNMDGKRLFEEITRTRPDMKVLFVSGYSSEILDGRGITSDGLNFLPKPVLPTELLKRVREILDGR